MINRVRKMQLAEAAALVPDGATVAIGRPPALALIRQLIARHARDLHLLGVPTGDIGVELLIDANAARSIESSGVDLGEFGQAPAFTREVEAGRLKVLDST